jgi:cell division protein FtsB
MNFIKIIIKKKFTLISIFLFLYLFINLLEGERGLISYYEKQKKIKNLIIKKELLVTKLTHVEKANNLLTDDIDLDYLETLYRKKFMVGKEGEKIYKIK